MTPSPHHVPLTPADQRTMLELLAYPPMLNEHPDVIRWRSLCAMLLTELNTVCDPRGDQGGFISYHFDDDEDPEIADAMNNHGEPSLLRCPSCDTPTGDGKECEGCAAYREHTSPY